MITLKAIICYHEYENRSIANFVNFIILNGKLFIHKYRLFKSPPLYKFFCKGFTFLMKSLKVVKGMSFVSYYEFVFSNLIVNVFYLFIFFGASVFGACFSSLHVL